MTAERSSMPWRLRSVGTRPFTTRSSAGLHKADIGDSNSGPSASNTISWSGCSRATWKPS